MLYFQTLFIYQQRINSFWFCQEQICILFLPVLAAAHKFAVKFVAHNCFGYAFNCHAHSSHQWFMLAGAGTWACNFQHALLANLVLIVEQQGRESLMLLLQLYKSNSENFPTPPTPINHITTWHVGFNYSPRRWKRCSTSCCRKLSVNNCIWINL